MTTEVAYKQNVDHVENVSHAEDAFLECDEIQDPTSITDEEKRLVRKIDWIILPCLSVCYIFFYIDKTTLSYAAIFGIEDSLHLTGNEYSWLSSIFYFGFLAWQLPTNLLMQRLPTATYLSMNIIAWGVLLALQAVSPNFATLAVLRGLSGAAEACADPSFMIITSMWYKRSEQPIRIGIWYSALGLGIAGGGVLGYGIGQIKGSLPSWKYEFIMIGALCIAWGIVMLVVLPNSPISTRYLTPGQRTIMVNRLRENQTGIENRQFKMHQFLEAITDVKVFLFFLIAFFQAIVNGGVTNFGTIIIQGFGFSTLGTTLLQIPYGIFIAVVILVCVWINAKMPPNSRCLMLLIFLAPNIAAAFGLCFVPQSAKVGRLICYYLTGSYNASFVMLLSLTTTNIAGHTKKVTSSGILFIGYCAGNIAGPFFYKESQKPTYSLGIWSMVVSHILEVVCVVLLWIYLRSENKKRDASQRINKDASNSKHLPGALEDITDKENSNFRYVF
ncbi:MFS general substrate transporter [Aspergillus caelatus]|uniref:MFS general substrate transporter n=1 Tax=Aspergillus caelatus TaxID=61420 RepID=A0A5N7A863_9EURO|nr:MFS general substrate transporter [Aspergillus caelatus]KAE8366034.1 MFS general substrate transporter [Aspergillus caelatus]